MGANQTPEPSIAGRGLISLWKIHVYKLWLGLNTLTSLFDQSKKTNKNPSNTKPFTPLNGVPQLLLGPQAPSDLVVVVGAVSCSSSRVEGQRRVWLNNTPSPSIQTQAHTRMNTLTHAHTPLITFLGVERVVVLGQRGAKNMIKNKTYNRFLPQSFLCSTPLPQFFVG